MRLLTPAEVAAETNRVWDSLFGAEAPAMDSEEAELDRLFVAANKLFDDLRFIPEMHFPTPQDRFIFALQHCQLRRLEETGRLL